MSMETMKVNMEGHVEYLIKKELRVREADYKRAVESGEVPDDELQDLADDVAIEQEILRRWQTGERP